MKILVIGANGQLGWELNRQGPSHGFDILPLDLPYFDITDRQLVDKHMKQADVFLVVNASAYTAVDKAESEPDIAFAVNDDGPGFVADFCAQVGIPLIHVSTDYVFDGGNKDLYLESDPVSPIGVYGKSKAAGEGKIREALREYIIIRTAWLYGVQGQNFVKTMLRLGKIQELISVVSDQFGCPTFAADLAGAILRIASDIRKERQVQWGTYHYSGKGVTTWHGFAKEIFRFAKKHDSFILKKIEAIHTSEYPTPAQRPFNSSLDCSLIGNCFGIYPKPWEESLGVMINRIYSENKIL